MTKEMAESEGYYKEVNELKKSLKKCGTYLVLFITLVGGSALYTWANSLKIPEMVCDIKSHEKRLTTVEVKQEQILQNTEEIKRWIFSRQTEGK